MYEASALRKKDIFIPIVLSALKGQQDIIVAFTGLYSIWRALIYDNFYFKKLGLLLDYRQLCCDFRISKDIFIFLTLRWFIYIFLLHIILSITISLIRGRVKNVRLTVNYRWLMSHDALTAYLLTYYSNLNAIKYIVRNKGYILTYYTIT